MVKIENYIPNLFTYANLFCGFLGIVSCVQGNLALAGMLVFLGAFFDVFDGLSARMLKITSTVGRELDSLVDMTTFGVLPALITHLLLLKSHNNAIYNLYIADVPLLSLVPFAIAAGTAWRLARFNVEDSPNHYFQGMPSPAQGMFFASLPLIAEHDLFIMPFNTLYLAQIVTNPWFLIVTSLLLAWLMISRVPLFSLKQKSMRWKDAHNIYILLVASILLIGSLLWAAVPIILLLYVFLSLVNKPISKDEI